MRRVKRFSEGGVGYEEDPKPGAQFKTISEKKPKKDKKKTASRKMSTEEFLEEYELAPASGRMKQEARYSADTEPGAEPVYPEAAVLAGRALKGLKDAQIPLRVKQMLRRAKTSRANEAERTADKAGEAARKGMSRRDTPEFSERYRAQKQAQENREALREGREPRDIYGILSTDTPNRFIPNWGGKPWRKGGHVRKHVSSKPAKVSASRRGDGIAKKGKTRGKFV